MSTSTIWPPMVYPQAASQRMNWTPPAAQPNTTTYINPRVTQSQIYDYFKIIDMDYFMFPQIHNISVEDFGYVGVQASSTGSMTNGQYTLTITGAALPANVRPGSGIGVANAGPTDSLTVYWWPTPTLRARVVSVSGNTITLDSPAARNVTNVAVYVDDSLPVQAALDHAGTFATSESQWAVQVPASNASIGSPDAKNNQPLYIDSYVTLTGAGESVTTFRACDRVAMVSIGQSSEGGFVGHPEAAYFYPTAAMISNRANIYWHGGLPYTSQFPSTPPNFGGGVKNITLDGNIFNQPAISPGNRTGSVPGVEGFALPDLRAVMQVDAVPLVGPPPADKLKNNHLYYVGMTYVDAQGHETSVGNGGWSQVQIPNDGANYQLAVNCRTPPAGAVSAVLYIVDWEDGNYGTAGWNWFYPPYGITPESQGLVNLIVWNRTDLGYVPASAEVVTINHYTAADAADNTYAPGGTYAERSLGFTAATCPYGIFLDNVTGFVIANVMCNNFGLDGVTLGSADFGYVYPPPHPANNTAISDLICNNNSREGCGITGSASNNSWLRYTSSNQDWAFDCEIDSGAGQCDNNTFTNCTFYSCQFIMAIFENSPAHGIVLSNCNFDKSALIQNGAGVTQITVNNCIFSNTYTAAVAARGAHCDLTLNGCTFQYCGKYHPPFPDQLTGDQPWTITLSNGGSYDPGTYYTHLTLNNCTIMQLDVPGYPIPPGLETLQQAVWMYLGPVLNMQNVSCVTQTNPMNFAIGGWFYTLNNVTGNYQIIAGP